MMLKVMTMKTPGGFKRFCLVATFLGLGGACGLTAPPVTVHTGIANASAVVLLDDKTFVTASDEANVLQMYPIDTEGPAIAQLDLSHFAGVFGKSTEIDLEGAARIGDRVYWIGSHGRNKDGKPRHNRQRLLATRFEGGKDGGRLVPEGKPYAGFLDVLLADPRYEALGLRKAAAVSPDVGGLNIEGLGANAEGHLLVGFRSPLVDGKALLVPILNPPETIDGGKARLGDPVLLDLGGLGVRDMVWSGKEHFIIGGGVKGAARARLFRWEGGTAPVEEIKGTGFKHFNPEAITVIGTGESRELLVLSDDGNQQKKKAEPTFRSFRVKP
jgi:Protein of unknown function (DUF3616)